MGSAARPALNKGAKMGLQLSAVSANDYAILKNKILARVGLSPICAAQKFHD